MPPSRVITVIECGKKILSSAMNGLTGEVVYHEIQRRVPADGRSDPVTLYSESERDRVLPPALLYELGKFAEYADIFSLAWTNSDVRRTLQKIYTFMKVQEGMGKIKKFFKQADNSARLDICRSELAHSLSTFRVGMKFILGQ
ncbi:hypothetical protein C8J57DRAFT_1228194 [Mycena rebaudengoi]|nr:hypothetical protein C8J57DRAFT_1228194 [Mycena rebaudengoi]